MQELVENLKRLRVLVENEELEEALEQIDELIYQHEGDSFIPDMD